MFLFRTRLRRFRVAYLPLGNADRIYDAVVHGADVLSWRLTATTQRGSIPATQSVVLCTLALVPVVVLALGARDRPEFALWDSPLQVVVGLLILAAALGGTVMSNRLAAVLLVGVTGYGCGAIFAFHGAPDLALTQFLVETLTLVIFVLVLRTLPAEADRADIERNRLPRAALALAVGATVTTLAVFAMAARTGVGMPRSCPTPPTTAGRAPTPSTCCWSTSAPGTPSVRSACCLSLRPVWRHWCSGTGGLAPPPGSPTPADPMSAASLTPATVPRPATSPGCAAASFVTRGTGPWFWRSPPG